MSAEQNQSRWDKFKGSLSAGVASLKNKINTNPVTSSNSKASESNDLSTLKITDVLFVYSPIFIEFLITSLSFFFQNWKGIIYLAFLIASCLLRDLVYRNMFSNTKETTSIGNAVCDSIKYTEYGNISFSSYVFAFTIVYLSIPMFVNKSYNPWLFAGIILYFVLDIVSKYRNSCITKVPELFINILFGGILSTIIVLSMTAGGSSKYLFFNEIQSSKQQCSQPSKQEFKCDVYKDGKLVQSL
jgi:hypothetical protein